jgi:hypothetical protein
MSVLGGVISLLVRFYILVVVIVNLKTLIWSNNPFLSSILQAYNGQNNVIQLNDISFVALALVNYTKIPIEVD